MRKLSFLSCLLLAFGLLLCGTMQAQEFPSSAGILILKDGTSIPGSLHTLIPGRYIKWEHRDGRIHKYDYSRVDRIEAGSVVLPSEEIVVLEEQNSFPAWYGDFSVEMIIGNNGDRMTNKNGYSASLSGGYQWNQWFGAGIYTAYTQMVDITDESFQPIALQLRTFLSKRQNSPFLKLNMGYGRLLVRDADMSGIVPNQAAIVTGGHGGVFVQPMAGYRFQTKNKMGFGFYAGYIHQQAELEWTRVFWGWGGEFEDVIIQDLKYNRYMAGFSVMF